MKIAFFAFLLAVYIPCCAQQDSCDLGSVTDTAPLIYPPIARAAHVSGNVILMVSFETNGKVGHVNVISGPDMLRASAMNYVQGWEAAVYAGPRTCPIVIHYTLDSENYDKDSVVRMDAQHVGIYSYTPCLCDPSPDINVKRRKRFWIF